MLAHQASFFGPLELVEAALSWPPFSLLIAVIIVGGIGIVAGRDRRIATEWREISPQLARTYLPERRALGAAALGVIVVFFVEFVLRGYVFTGSEVWSWRFAVPLAAATIGLSIVLVLIVTRGSTRPERPAGPSARRTWRSFSGRGMLVVAALALAALVVTTIAAGSASTRDGEGRYAWLSIPIPNEPGIDPIRLPFYGWTYGVPVLVSLVVLVAVGGVALSRSAARPFLSPRTAAAERAARRATAGGITSLVLASTLLALAGAWRLLARAGSGQSLTVMGQNDDAPYDAAWRFGEFAVAAGWGAPVVEIAAFSLLLLLATGGLRRVARTAVDAASVAAPTGMRVTR